MDAAIYLLETIRRRRNFEKYQAWLDEKLFSNTAYLDVFRTIRKALRFGDCGSVDYPQLIAMSKEVTKNPDRWEEVEEVVKKMARVRSRQKVQARMSQRFLINANVHALIEDLVGDIGTGHDVNIPTLIASLHKLENIGETSGLDTDLFINPEARIDNILHIGRPVPTVLPELTAVMDGGPCAGDLITLIALPDGGKSLFLLDTAATAIEAGYNTFVAVLERGRSCIARLDCRITNHTAKWLCKYPRKFVEIIKAKGGQNASIRVADYSRVETSVPDIRKDAIRFGEDYGGIDLFVVDYGDLLKSSRRYDSKRHELNLVWVELKRLAEELSCPIYTATQSNRKGASTTTLDMANVAEDWSKMGTTDIVLTLNQTPKEKARNEGRVFVAKTKKTGGSLLIPVGYDRLRCKVRAIGDHRGRDSGNEEGENAEESEEVQRTRRRKILFHAVRRKRKTRKKVDSKEARLKTRNRRTKT